VVEYVQNIIETVYTPLILELEDQRFALVLQWNHHVLYVGSVKR
jgi:hypothetical protein